MADRKLNKLTATAYHETGHAFMCWRLGTRLKRITIVSDKESAGLTQHENAIRGRYPEADNSNRLKMERHAMIALAGPISQQLYKPRSFRRYHASTDYATAADLAIRVNNSEAQAEAWLKWLEIRTRDALRDFWPVVEGFAKELLRSRVLAGAQAEQLILDLVQKRGQDQRFLKRSRTE